MTASLGGSGVPDVTAGAAAAPPTVTGTTRPAAPAGRRRQHLAPSHTEPHGQRTATRDDQADRPALRTTAGIVALYLLLSLFLYHGLWADPDGRYLVDSGMDQTAFEWLFAVGAHKIAHLDNPLFTTLQNAPLGVNLMANASMLGVSIPLAPLTLSLGPAVTWAVVLTAGLAATAAAWYWLLVRWLVRSPWAAAIGGGVCAFAPPMISHGNAHPNLAVLFVIPLIIDRLLRLTRDGRVLRDGVILGLLVTYQIFVGEEALLLTAIGLLVFAAAYAFLEPRRARAAAAPLLRGMAVTAAVCLPLIAYPLAWQFLGEQSYSGIMHHPQSFNPPQAMVEFAGRSLAGDELTADRLSMNRTEQNAFFGWPLLTLVVALVIALRRQALVRALAGTAFVAALLSLGARISVPATELVIPGPWRLLEGVPILDSIVESRLAMVCVPVFGILVALACDALAERGDAVSRWVAWGGVAAALVPILPTPYPTADRPDVPAFIVAGTWRQYVQPGETLVVVPLPGTADTTALQWQIAADLGFPVAGGYFVGPYAPHDRIGVYGAYPRDTTRLLDAVSSSGEFPEIGSEERRLLQEDLQFWRAGAVVIGRTAHEEPLRTVLEQLFQRPGEQVGGVWVWRAN